MQSVDIDTSQTNLLIKLPCGTIRRVRYQHQDPFPVSRLQDAIECEMGFPSEIYQLKYGDQWLLANTSNKMMVRNGALVQLILKAEWKLLYESVLDKATDLTAVLQICNLDVSADQSDTATSHERRHDPQDFLRSTLPDSGLKTSDSCSDNTQVDSFRLFVAVCLLCRTRQPDLILLEQLLHGELAALHLSAYFVTAISQCIGGVWISCWGGYMCHAVFVCLTTFFFRRHFLFKEYTCMYPRFPLPSFSSFDS